MGFSSDWLALREPADQAARNRSLAQRAAQSAGQTPLIVDLGCGTGATRRALGPYLPDTTRWCFVDSDPALLAIAAADAGRYAEIIEADLTDLSRLPLGAATLITASALLDLVSEVWVRELADRLGVPFYSALNYSGAMSWRPQDAADTTVTEHFNRHQRSDKGFGTALGPEACERSAQIFSSAGFDVAQAPSPWQLGPDMAELQCELTGGIAAAALEAGCVDATRWGRHRQSVADRSECRIEHIDMLVLPAGHQPEHAADAG